MVQSEDNDVEALLLQLCGLSVQTPLGFMRIRPAEATSPERPALSGSEPEARRHTSRGSQQCCYGDVGDTRCSFRGESSPIFKLFSADSLLPSPLALTRNVRGYSDRLV